MQANLVTRVLCGIGLFFTLLSNMSAQTDNNTSTFQKSNEQAPGYYRYNVGSFQVTAITDGMNPMPLTDYYVENASKEDVIQAMKNALLPTDVIPLPFTAVVINTGHKIVVVDTGLGETIYQSSKGKMGQFYTNFKAAGFDVNKVDCVLITHFHADHIGGLLTAKNTSMFPNAIIYLPKEEYNFWMNNHNMHSDDSEVVKANFARAQRIFGIVKDQIQLFDIGQEIVAGIRSVSTMGHTPGHTSYIVTSGEQKLFIQGDLTNIAALFVVHPEWHVWSDMDKNQAEKERRHLYEMLASDPNMMIQGFHFPFPGVGKIIKENNGYRYIPVMWNAYGFQ